MESLSDAASTKDWLETHGSVRVASHIESYTATLTIWPQVSPKEQLHRGLREVRPLAPVVSPVGSQSQLGREPEGPAAATDETGSPMTLAAQHEVPLSEVAQAFQGMLQGLEGIEAILVTQDKDGLQVFVVVNNVRIGFRQDIHKGEWELMQRYPKLGLDFRVIDRRDRALDDLLSLEPFDVCLRA